MPRLKTILQSEFPYNISVRCINREWFNIPMQDVWDIFSNELADTVQKHKLQVHSFVLMSNHIHLIATTPDENLSQCMHRFLTRSSNRLNRKGNRINETFAGRYYKCILQNTNYYLNAYKYNYRNPVTAGICKNVEEYPFSTIQDILGIKFSKIPLVEDTTYMNDTTGTLKWLNSPTDPKKYEVLRNCFRHQYFTSRKNKNTKLPIIGDNDLL